MNFSFALVEINRHEVIVYPDDSNKPSIGEGLNRRARITLLGVYPIDRTTREEITDIDRIKAMQYDEYLRKLTEKFDGQFIHYGLADGSWTFWVRSSRHRACLRSKPLLSSR